MVRSKGRKAATGEVVSEGIRSKPCRVNLRKLDPAMVRALSTSKDVLEVSSNLSKEEVLISVEALELAIVHRQLKDRPELTGVNIGELIQEYRRCVTYYLT